MICCDWTGAGAGETVYWCRGKESSFSFLPAEVPTDFSIVGIVDSIHSEEGAGMLIARVVGELTATRKHPSHEGCKLLLVQPLNLDGSNGRPRGGGGFGGCRRGRQGPAGDAKASAP